MIGLVAFFVAIYLISSYVWNVKKLKSDDRCVILEADVSRLRLLVHELNSKLELRDVEIMTLTEVDLVELKTKIVSLQKRNRLMQQEINMLVKVNKKLVDNKDS